ncbi:UNVERIFIED_CONTAM: hypothetical protein GTU68_047793, partial [Idotea baltica]|nr:hypothetical protein [Idotea baltica]
LYSFLSRRTPSRFNNIIHKRLNQSRLNRYPISVSRITKILKNNTESKKIVAVIGTVTDDVRLLTVPEGLKVCALKFTTQARERITSAKGQCLTFDQLAQVSPTGSNILLLRGPRDREAKRHFGLYPGQKGSHTAPRVR